MDNLTMSVHWIRMAVLYLTLGVALGLTMGMQHDFSLRSVHAHLNLLGWVSMLGMGLLLRLWADELNPRLARAQFWLHQLALPPMLVALSMVVRGRAELEPVLGLASMAVGLSVLLLLVNVWACMRPRSLA